MLLLTSDPTALSKDGILNTAEFFKARKYEVTELEKAQLNSKFASSTRTFQSLPRTLRRRTASHNVKRIPKRLRNRALREMSADSGTPTTKSNRLKGRDIYRARTISSLLKLGARLQLNKQLPDSPSLGKLKLRQRIKALNAQLSASNDDSSKLNNVIGSYDITTVNALSPVPIGKIKYNKRQQENVWLNTHVWHAKRAHMMKRWGWQIPLKPTQKCFRAAHRGFHLEGAIAWDKSYVNTLVIQCENESSIVAMLNMVIVGKQMTVLKNNGHSMMKLIKIDDEIIGEITVLTFQDTTTKRIVMRVHPSIYGQLFAHLVNIKTEDVEIIDDRFSIGSIELTGPISLPSLATILKPLCSTPQSRLFGDLCCQTTLPERTMFMFMAQDPRLANRTKPRQSPDINPLDSLLHMNTTGANIDNEVINSLFTSDGRTQSYKDQHSLKQVAQEKSNKSTAERCKGTGFPVIMYKLDSKWTVLLPWFWCLPVWHSLMHIAHVKLGGLKQSHQMMFETGRLFFPVDFPFTVQGSLENQMASDVKRLQWERKPVSKKVNFDKVKINDSEVGELGDPFGCDWRYLQVLRTLLPHVMSDKISRTSSWVEFERKVEELHDVFNLIDDVKRRKVKSVSSLPISLGHATQYPADLKTPLYITPVSLRAVARGNMSDNARIYSIPSDDLERWLAVTRHVANDKQNHDEYPLPPSSTNLIGFVTSGTYNLGAGKNTGVGCIDSVWCTKGEQYVLVRNVGTNIARLAKWEEINPCGAM